MWRLTAIWYYFTMRKPLDRSGRTIMQNIAWFHSGGKKSLSHWEACKYMARIEK